MIKQILLHFSFYSSTNLLLSSTNIIFSFKIFCLLLQILRSRFNLADLSRITCSWFHYRSESFLTFDSCLFVLYACDKDPNFKQKVLWFWDGTYNTSLRLFFQSWSLNWVKTSFEKGQTKLFWTEKKEVVLLLVINLARTGRQKYDSSVFCKFSARWNVS